MTMAADPRQLTARAPRLGPAVADVRSAPPLAILEEHHEPLRSSRAHPAHVE